MTGLSLPAKAVLALLLVTLAAGAGWRHGVKSTEARWNAERLVQTVAAGQANQFARDAERSDARNAKEAIDAYAKKLQTANTRIADARRDADSVRNDTAAIASAATADPTDACGPERARLAAVAGLLGTSAGLLERGADLVEGLDAKVILARDSYPKE